jgi:hypothetical protein
MISVVPASINTPVFHFSDANADTFYRAISAAKNFGKETEIQQGILGTLQSKWFGSCVHIYSVEEYQDMRRILFDEGRTGCAIKNKDIVSVFKHPECKIRPALDVVMPTAVQLGGNRLDCFNRGLPQSYSKYGFFPVAKVHFEVRYAPQDWNYARDEQPDIIYMIYRKEIAEKKWESDDERIKQVKAIISDLNYVSNEDALSIQLSSCMI